MLETVYLGQRYLESYRAMTPQGTLEAISRHAEDLQGVRVLHLNATPHGGAVSDFLRSLVPHLNNLGLAADWKIIGGDEAFFRMGKALWDGLQGAGAGLRESERAACMEGAKRNAALLEDEYDFIFAHDAPSVAMLASRHKGNARWVWRCHVDASSPHRDVWGFLLPHLASFDASVFMLSEFVPQDLPVARVETIPPAIDPLNPRNIDLQERTARQLLEWVGIRLDRPLVTQIARFDLWKDPLWAITAFELARAELHEAQMAVVAFVSPNDPESWELYHRVSERARRDPRIHVLTNLAGVGNMEVNAFQRLSHLIVQKSFREGFGLGVSEALWKGTPVVAGASGGIPLQMADGIGGLLVENVQECATAIVDLIHDPERRNALGQRGKERVQRYFLFPRLLLNELLLMKDLVRDQLLRVEPAIDARRDPCCGMAISGEGSLPDAAPGRPTYVFCSEECRMRFLRRSEGHAGHRSET